MRKISLRNTVGATSFVLLLVSGMFAQYVEGAEANLKNLCKVKNPEIDLKGYPNATDKDLDCFRSKKVTLKKLVLNDNITNEGIKSLNIQELHLGDNQNITNEGIKDLEITNFYLENNKKVDASAFVNIEDLKKDLRYKHELLTEYFKKNIYDAKGEGKSPVSIEMLKETMKNVFEIFDNLIFAPKNKFTPTATIQPFNDQLFTKLGKTVNLVDLSGDVSEYSEAFEKQLRCITFRVRLMLNVLSQPLARQNLKPN